MSQCEDIIGLKYNDKIKLDIVDGDLATLKTDVCAMIQEDKDQCIVLVKVIK